MAFVERVGTGILGVTVGISGLACSPGGREQPSSAKPEAVKGDNPRGSVSEAVQAESSSDLNEKRSSPELSEEEQQQWEMVKTRLEKKAKGGFSLAYELRGDQIDIKVEPKYLYFVDVRFGINPPDHNYASAIAYVFKTESVSYPVSFARHEVVGPSVSVESIMLWINSETNRIANSKGIYGDIFWGEAPANK